MSDSSLRPDREAHVANQISLAMGDYELSDQVVAWKVQFVDAIPPAVKLILSIQSPPTQMTGMSQGETATSLALLMDARAALDLHRRIGLLATRMGWRLPE